MRKLGEKGLDLQKQPTGQRQPYYGPPSHNQPNFGGPRLPPSGWYGPTPPSSSSFQQQPYYGPQSTQWRGRSRDNIECYCGRKACGPVYYKPYKFELQVNAGVTETPSTTEGGDPQTDASPTTEGEDPPSPEEPSTPENPETPPERTPCANTTQKACICLFTCAYTRAVHLEHVSTNLLARSSTVPERKRRMLQASVRQLSDILLRI